MNFFDDSESDMKMLFENTAELHLEQGSTVAIEGMLCLRSAPKLLLRK